MSRFDGLLPDGEYKGVPYFVVEGRLYCKLKSYHEEFPSVPALRRGITAHLKKSRAWVPQFSRWRHGGWYVDNIRYPTGGCGCVSNNYDDRQWRIVNDSRRSCIGAADDFTFRTRDEAAQAEYNLVIALTL